MSGSITWLRRDLRVAANAAMAAAQEDGPTHVVFVVEPRLWAGAGAPRRRFLRQTLVELDHQLDGRLVVRTGDPAREIPALAREVGAARVVCGWDWTPLARARDRAVADALGRERVGFERAGSPYAVDPGTVRTGEGRAYRVFTPYHRRWREQPVRVPPDADVTAIVGTGGAGVGDLPVENEPAATWAVPGRSGAMAALDGFLAGPADRYAERRDDPAADLTSRLSAALHFGAVHPAEVLVRLDPSNPGHSAFARQLAWRDFYAQVLADRPDSAWSNYRPEAAVETDHGPETEAGFRAWCEGRTGFPFVDAGMRQLRAEGWMHNRLRMVTASFLVKDLHLDWQWGARFFLRHLVDGDVANNNHGWQWVAGTGTDASPYHRIFNPTGQGRRFDPDGEYIRRWVPELAELDADALHEPGGTLAAAAAGYPDPLVDHAVEREEALRRLAEAKR